MSTEELRCPVVETLEQATDIGVALHRVFRWNADWAPNVFSSRQAHWNTGLNTVNEELNNYWADVWTPEQKRKLITELVKLRLSR